MRALSSERGTTEVEPISRPQNPVVLRARAFAARFFHQKRAVQRTPRPIVSFTFDDFPRSALTVGGRILAEHGVRGTYYTAMGLLGQRTVVGDMFDGDDLDELVAAGHELACHTVGHTRCSMLTPAGVVASCEENQRQIMGALGGRRPTSFSFPEGVVTASAKKALESIYQTCRTIEPGINRDPVDAGLLRANPVYSRRAPSKLHKVILKNQKMNGWLILYTHDVTPNPSAYGCTPQEFRELVRCAVESGADVLPVADAWARFRPINKL